MEKTIEVRIAFEVNEDEIWDLIQYLRGSARHEDAEELEEVWFEVWGKE